MGNEPTAKKKRTKKKTQKKKTTTKLKKSVNGTIDKDLAKENKILEYRAMGLTQQTIANKMKCSQKCVSDCLKRSLFRIEHEVKERARSLIYDQIIKLEYASEQAMIAWHESKENIIIKREKKVSTSPTYDDEGDYKPGQERSESFIEEVVQIGNPKYLAEYRKLQQDIRAVLGLNAVPAQDPNNVNITTVLPLEHLSDEQLEALEDIQSTIREKVVIDAE